jgi:hypothetical protein
LCPDESQIVRPPGGFTSLFKNYLPSLSFRWLLSAHFIFELEISFPNSPISLVLGAKWMMVTQSKEMLDQIVRKSAYAKRKGP